MLLYSTILNIRPSFTKEDFVRLVIEWNQAQADWHPQNVIPGICWDGQMNVRFGNEALSLRIEEYRNGNIVAVRYEKKAEDGAIWDTDYILNFNEMRIAIRLDRSYTEGMQEENMPFSTPRFVSFLIRDNWLEDDAGFPVLDTPIIVNNDNIDVLKAAVQSDHKCRLPIVYISRTAENLPATDCKELSKRLKGIAHVVVEEDAGLGDAAREALGEKAVSDGDVAIYYPNGKMIKLPYGRFARLKEYYLFHIAETRILRYCNQQNVSPLYTWWGVLDSLSNDKLESNKKERQQAQADLKAYVDEFDPQYRALESDYKAALGRLAAMEQENLSLRARLNNGDKEPLLYRGEEDDLYPDEVREVVLAAIENKANESDEASRRGDILKDIVAHNEFHHEVSIRRQKIKDLKVGIGKLSSAQRSELEALGILIVSENHHYKMNLNGDARYMVTMAKTGSDNNRGSENTAAQINRTMF